MHCILPNPAGLRLFFPRVALGQRKAYARTTLWSTLLPAASAATVLRLPKPGREGFADGARMAGVLDQERERGARGVVEAEVGEQRGIEEAWADDAGGDQRDGVDRGDVLLVAEGQFMEQDAGPAGPGRTSVPSAPSWVVRVITWSPVMSVTVTGFGPLGVGVVGWSPAAGTTQAATSTTARAGASSRGRKRDKVHLSDGRLEGRAKRSSDRIGGNY
ncbi:hypothetical protein [Kribbella italica]|uniref:Uncharacterized protein n=1 Tax=Kribbella italica TaxID=1540520 RepID=A0A7W9J7Y2_9ACTN|nr:hypothetical protein [Kribbella italica]MBB5836800.1 hypothetical protein [Kribbella italica]